MSSYSDDSLTRVAKHLTGEESKEGALRKFFSFIESFPPGSKLLILGSGGNSLTKELESKYPDIDFAACDYRYGHNSTKSPTKTKIMVGGDWNKLPFSSESFQGFICHHSFPYWARSRASMESGLLEIDRVVKSDAKMIFTGYGNTLNDMQNFFKISEKIGWSTDTSIIQEEMDGSIVYRGGSTKI